MKDSINLSSPFKIKTDCDEKILRVDFIPPEVPKRELSKYFSNFGEVIDLFDISKIRDGNKHEKPSQESKSVLVCFSSLNLEKLN